MYAQSTIILEPTEATRRLVLIEKTCKVRKPDMVAV